MSGKKTLLNRDVACSAIEYLKSEKRRFTDEDIDNAINVFDLGYMPEYVNNEFGDTHEFAGRIIIPIHNQYGELIALDSRDWREKAFMKFFHESFVKSYYLYGLNVSKQDIVKEKSAIVVEGSFDTQFLYLRGIKNVVGMLGSVLHLHQIALLRRYCKKIFLVFDGDAAGTNAAKSVQALSKDNMLSDFYDLDIITVNMPFLYDPDELVSEGVDKFKDLLCSAEKEYYKEK